MLLATEEEACILWNMSCEIKSIIFKIKIIKISLMPWEKDATGLYENKFCGSTFDVIYLFNM